MTTTTVDTAKTEDAELLRIEEALWRANRAGVGSFYARENGQWLGVSHQQSNL